MCEALRQAEKILSGWLAAHGNCYPPIVINITDGESTDGNRYKLTSEIKGLCSSDGNVLLFNLHISSSHHAPILFPDSEDDLPDADAKLLFKMSSLLPDHMWAMVQDEGIVIKENPRGFVNAASGGFNQVPRYWYASKQLAIRRAAMHVICEAFWLQKAGYGARSIRRCLRPWRTYRFRSRHI